MLSWYLVGAPPHAWGGPKAAGKQVVPPLQAIERDYLTKLDAADAPVKKEATITVVLLSGKRYRDLTVSGINLTKNGLGFRNISFSGVPTGVPKVVQGSTLRQVVVGEVTFEVLHDVANKCFVLIDQSERDRVVAKRLEAISERLWPVVSDEEHQTRLAESRELFDKTREMFSDRKFILEETKYFLFLTDMPPKQIEGYLKNLDAMYDQLCLAFGVPEGTNIWLGKCPVVALTRQADFARFEAEQMNYPGTGTAQGLCHSFSDGRVVISCYRGDDPTFFGVVLVHETAHGFLHRFRSTVVIPGWINEGIADWVAGLVVTGSDHLVDRKQSAVVRLRESGQIGRAFFGGTAIEPWQYGVASGITDLMVSKDGAAYRAFLVAIKEGYPPAEALELTYGIKLSDLVASYGRSIGIPNLAP